MSFYFEACDAIGTVVYTSTFYSSMDDLENAAKKYAEDEGMTVVLWKTNGMFNVLLGKMEYNDVSDSVRVEWYKP